MTAILAAKRSSGRPAQDIGKPFVVIAGRKKDRSTISEQDRRVGICEAGHALIAS